MHNDKPSTALSSAKADARLRLLANPDLVFEEIIRLTIRAADADYWLTFASEWGGAVYLLDEKNTKRYERGELPHETYEIVRRTYRLGLMTLSALYDRLKAWKDGGAADDYTLSLNQIDCYLLPGYLHDYCGLQAASLRTVGEAYMQRMSEAFGEGETRVARVEALHTLVQEYIEQLHWYARA